MKCPTCHQHCKSTLSKQYAKQYLVSKVPIHVRYARRLRKYLWGWPPSGWTR